MSELSWADLRARAIALFDGQLPNAQTESEIIDAFERAPLAATSSLETVAADYAAGKVRSGWAVWRSNLARAASPARNPTVELGNDREKRVRNAERWLGRVGCLYSRWEICDGELFDERGSLHAWADDLLLRQRLEGLWRTHRPAGERVEAEELQRAEAWKASRERVLAVAKARRERLDAAQTKDERTKGAA